jgi:phosphate transport system permease protein
MGEMTLLDPTNVRQPVTAKVTDGGVQRRRRPAVSRDTIFDLLGAAAAGASASFLLFGRLAAFSGSIGFFLVAYFVFLIVYALLISLRENVAAIWDALMTVVLTSAGVVAFGALAMVVSFTLWRGHTALLNKNFFTQDMSRAGPLAPLHVGGVAHALVGTLWTIGIAVVLTVPLGIVCAIYLDQTRGRLARFVRTIVLAMTALPSILAGLFIYASWILTFGFQQSGFAAALALSIMMLPYIIRTSDLVLRLVPGGLREASAALGASRWRTVWHVVVPTARSGLATGVILGIARGIGEASPVLLTAGFTTYINADPFHGPMVSLPLEALKLVQSGVPAYVARGFAAATFLLLVIMGLFILARVIGGWGPGNLNRRQRRRAERASARDVARFSRMSGGVG